MASTNRCPIPEVRDVLAPYVRSRQETSRIRKTLAKYLAAQLNPSDTDAHHTQHLQLESPSLSNAAVRATNDVKHRRSSYFRAVQAKLTAEERHKTLQHGLDEQHYQHFAEVPAQIDSTYESEVIRSYTLLLHQRARFAALSVIRDSLGKLLECGSGHHHKDPKILVTSIIGEQVNLPSERLEVLDRDSEVDDGIFKLKKELLDVKGSVERSIRDRSDGLQYPSGRENTSLKDEVHGLACARQELVQWVESALARISEGDLEILEIPSPTKKDSRTASFMEKSVHEFYREYTAARAAIIDTFPVPDTTTPRTSRHLRIEQSTPLTSSVSEPTSSKIVILDIQTYIQELLQFSERERALLEGAVYLQVQLSTASGYVKESLARLSNESHLLLSGPPSLETWKSAIEKYQIAVRKSILEYLDEDNYKGDSIENYSNSTTFYHRLIDDDF
ncbi:hypothetical protein GQ43DRAFT_394915 [Delitschia confertaspora ATCC 74209]|uniref:Uncharacterized protein n=1 Tax=Delitschia confertaspora ATCC 74209 TaxID=1513339 RepID=A0A9P4JKF8_9PLEO|nr:hypothetical protein GQ43DRAFT_394915 [Delitschia confertaspora ATCC 74209]